jgi:hypothetical protein
MPEKADKNRILHGTKNLPDLDLDYKGEGLPRIFKYQESIAPPEETTEIGKGPHVPYREQLRNRGEGALRSAAGFMDDTYDTAVDAYDAIVDIVRKYPEAATSLAVLIPLFAITYFADVNNNSNDPKNGLDRPDKIADNRDLRLQKSDTDSQEVKVTNPGNTDSTEQKDEIEEPQPEKIGNLNSQPSYEANADSVLQVSPQDSLLAEHPEFGDLITLTMPNSELNDHAREFSRIANFTVSYVNSDAIEKHTGITGQEIYEWSNPNNYGGQTLASIAADQNRKFAEVVRNFLNSRVVDTGIDITLAPEILRSNDENLVAVVSPTEIFIKPFSRPYFVESANDDPRLYDGIRYLASVAAASLHEATENPGEVMAIYIENGVYRTDPVPGFLLAQGDQMTEGNQNQIGYSPTTSNRLFSELGKSGLSSGIYQPAKKYTELQKKLENIANSTVDEPSTSSQTVGEGYVFNW